MELPIGLKTTLRERLGPVWRAASSCKAAIRENVAVHSARRQLTELRKLEKPFFVVGIPGSLHVVDLCLSCVPSTTNVVLVSNGMDAWEQKWARQHLSVRSIVAVGSVLEHGGILDLLFDHFPDPFGILDYDCFVFDPSYFSRLTDIASGSMLNSLFAYRNTLLGIDIPETFILFFNTRLIASLRSKYRVNCRMVPYGHLNRRVKERLALVGIDESHMPEDFKSYFDALRLVVMLGTADGYRCDFLEKFSTRSPLSIGAFHVGGVSSQNRDGRYTIRWNLRGAYFWRRALEVHADAELRRRYLERYGDATASQILAHNPLSRQIAPEFLSFVERVVHKLEPPFRHLPPSYKHGEPCGGIGVQ